MTSATSRLDHGIGRRIAPRTKCAMVVEFKDGSAAWTRAMLADISATGFRLTGLRPGFDRQSIWLRALDLEPLPAKVRWAADQSIGCEFLYPLDSETETAFRERIAEATTEPWRAVA
jgi:hypothetical protein